MNDPRDEALDAAMEAGIMATGSLAYQQKKIAALEAKLKESHLQEISTTGQLQDALAERDKFREWNQSLLTTNLEDDRTNSKAIQLLREALKVVEAYHSHAPLRDTIKKFLEGQNEG